MTDRKKKAIDYLNSRKVKKEVSMWLIVSAILCALIVAIIIAVIEIIK